MSWSSPVTTESDFIQGLTGHLSYFSLEGVRSVVGRVVSNCIILWADLGSRDRDFLIEQELQQNLDRSFEYHLQSLELFVMVQFNFYLGFVRLLVWSTHSQSFLNFQLCLFYQLQSSQGFLLPQLWEQTASPPLTRPAKLSFTEQSPPCHFLQITNSTKLLHPTTPNSQMHHQ